MMNKTDKAEKILNTMLDLYNLKNDCDYTFKTICIEDEFCGCFAHASVNERPYLYFSTYICNITEFFDMEIYERKGNTDDDHILIFKHTSY